MEKLVIQALPSRDFWRASRVSFTGHTGFRRAWMLCSLNDMRARVTRGLLAPKRPEGPVEAQTLALDPTRAGTDLGNRGLWDLDKILIRSAQWYRRFLVGRQERELYEADCCAYVDSVNSAPMVCIR